MLQQPGSEQPAAKKQRSNISEHEQQQQQQGDADSSISRSLTMPELKQLLKQQLTPASYTNYIVTLNHWSRACGSADVRALLYNVDALVQHLTAVDAAGSTVVNAKSAGCYLSCASALLKVPQVQQLLDADGREQLRKKVKEARALLQARIAAEAATTPSDQIQQQEEADEAVLRQLEVAAAGPAAAATAAAAAVGLQLSAAVGQLSGSKRTAEQQVSHCGAMATPMQRGGRLTMTC
jgi:hypothetical protein